MSFVEDVARRSVAARLDTAAEEIQRIVDATYVVIARTGSLDPPLRAVIRESGCSNQAFYRHFASKDDLMLGLCADGRRRLAETLRRRAATTGGPARRVEAWIRGVLLQAADRDAAARTRPFVAGLARLEVLFPDELRRSRDVILDTLAETLGARPAARADALAVYDLAFGAMQRHLLAGTKPGKAETEHVIRFALSGLGLASG
jgi:AcrR family transcriptional regulator